MKRNEFKLLMEDWKRNFSTEDSVVSKTLNEGYTELDRMILEEGLKDNPLIQKVMKLGIPLSLAATLLSSGLLNTQDTQQNVDNRSTVEYPAGVGSMLSAPAQSYDTEYDELFKDPDVANIVNNKNLKPEEAAIKVLELDLASKGFSGEQLPDYVDDGGGVPSVNNLGYKGDSVFKIALPDQIRLYRKFKQEKGK
jgi:hypothetical protein